ncbi:hypothetical protein NST21_17390 [Peribacillus sp. FSL K6-1552]|uniref:hypothetical protein n=1 Tax=Peribacillus TaxID=2675229 RepID=UPI0030F9C76C
MLQTKKGKVTLAIVGGICICWFLYHNLGIDDLVEKNKIYSRAEESFSDGDYYLAANRFKMIPGFRDSDQQLKEIYTIVAKDCTEFLTQRNMVKAKQCFEMVKDVPKYSKQANVALQQIEVKQGEKLKNIEPYEGMISSNIKYSSWGPPTEIEREVNYDSLRPDRRVEHYKWIEKDEQGRTIRIKSLYVKQGFVLGDPIISNYYVGQ